MSNRVLKAACYFNNVTMSVAGNVPPLLFLIFREEYGVSYSLLGLLVLVNFMTQLAVDLVFSFFSERFNIPCTVRLMPVLTSVGLFLYALSPLLFPGAVYVGLVIGTVIFSAAAGLGEVLISPIIAALPSADPDREMSKLHSVYAWGVVGIIPLSTLFLYFFGHGAWQVLCIVFSLFSLIPAILFSFSKIPELRNDGKEKSIIKHLKSKNLWMCVLLIFLGGAAECTMAQWSSSYLEMALGVDKMIGDIFGVTLFAVMLGIGRTLYSRIGRNVEKIIFFGFCGATLCYLAAAISSDPIVCLAACALCGLFVSMLWPGSLIVAGDVFPKGGVFIFAMMAAGGDLGACVGPQLVGIVTDTVAASERITELFAGIGAEQLGMKAGILLGGLFPLCAIGVAYWFLKKKRS